MKIKKFIITISLSLMIPALTYCVSSDGPSPDNLSSTSNNNTIGFRSSLPSTRATITQSDLDDVNELKIWGYKTTNAPTEENPTVDWTQVFTTVNQDNNSLTINKKNGEWTYDHTEYWSDGYYSFQSIYSNASSDNPLELKFEEETNSLSIENFDATKHVDLLYANSTRLYPDEGAGKVPLNFQHLLSQVTFVGKAADNIVNDEITVTIKSVKLLSRFNTIQTWKSSSISKEKPSGEWDLIAGDEKLFVESKIKNRNFTKETNEFVDFFPYNKSEDGSVVEDNEILIFPMDLYDFSNLLNNATLEIVFSYSGSTTGGIVTGEDRPPYRIGLGDITGATNKWEAGKKYTYTFTIGANDFILFSAPSVTQWNENEIGGDVAVDRNEINNL